ncbi:hypothetical protein KM043_012860 [Ampulex compressa]|nr:hypothetical protein KM043_012860 [Ampulex compressa]
MESFFEALQDEIREDPVSKEANDIDEVWGNALLSRYVAFRKLDDTGTKYPSPIGAQVSGACRKTRSQPKKISSRGQFESQWSIACGRKGLEGRNGRVGQEPP